MPTQDRKSVENLQIRVLTDNYVARTHLLGEHGLCMLIEADDYRILFDTGPSRIALDNAVAMGIDLRRLDAVVLSHGHYDHTGGLADLLNECSPEAVFLHPAAVQAKFDRLSKPPRGSIGMPDASLAALNSDARRVQWTPGVTAIVPGVFCTGEIPRRAGNDQSTGDFFLDPECSTPDLLPDDQALFVETRDGIVVITGCLHSGMANTLAHVSTLTGADRIQAVVGGFHLMDSGPAEWNSACLAIERHGSPKLAPGHCTGLGAHAHLRNSFPASVLDFGVGARLVLAGDRKARHSAGGQPLED